MAVYSYTIDLTIRSINLQSHRSKKAGSFHSNFKALKKFLQWKPTSLFRAVTLKVDGPESLMCIESETSWNNTSFLQGWLCSTLLDLREFLHPERVPTYRRVFQQRDWVRPWGHRHVHRPQNRGRLLDVPSLRRRQDGLHQCIKVCKSLHSPLLRVSFHLFLFVATQWL